MLGLFKSKILLDTSSVEWLFEAFCWSLENFDAGIFYRNTVLVLPDNRFFPGRADNAHGMACIIFDRVRQYAAVGHWPARLTDYNSCPAVSAPQIEIKAPLRDPSSEGVNPAPDQPHLLIPYNPQQINNPEAMIATFAHILAHYLAQMARTPPPGGTAYWPQATELLAVFLGFGVMFANSAFSFRGGCGSCYNPSANRDAYLSEQEATYSLAIFSVLKGIPNAIVTKQLKSHLRGFYRKAVKDIHQRVADIERLRGSCVTADRSSSSSAITA